VAAVVVQIFGDVGQLREVAERTYHGQRLGGRQRIEHLLQLLAVAVVLRLAEIHRCAAHALDQLEGLFALLLAQGVAEDAAEQPDVFAQRYILAGDTGGSGDQVRLHHFMSSAQKCGAPDRMRRAHELNRSKENR